MIAPPAHEWPFRHPLVPALPAAPAEIRIDDLHEAFVNRQTANTRLVTTGASYLMQVWVDAAERVEGLRLVASADRAVLEEHAPELLVRRGPLARAPLEITFQASSARELPVLARALRASDPAERLRLCVAALDEARTAPALLTAASTCMEVNDLDAAARDLAEAIALAPDWPAAHFELGKLRLRQEAMDAAAEAFGRAVALMPSFTAGWANLGAVLGELDRPQEALAAFETALSQDPDNAQALNNVGVVSRELGRLDVSESAFRRVLALVPDRAFGHYNLGHTLFLQGRYQAALSAYVEGQRRDAEHNPVQATRLAMCRLATGDAAGALRDLRAATTNLPREYRRQLLADTQTIAWALLTDRPDLPGWQDVSTWLGAELAALS